MRRLIALSILLGASSLVACGSVKTTSPDDFTNDGGGFTGLDGSVPNPGDETGLSVGCNPPCTGTQVCSVTNTCIEKGTCLVDGDCGAGMKCDPATKKCVPGGECGAEEATATAVPANVLIVLDRSCSMTSKVGAQTKWQIAVKAIDDLTKKFAGKLRFGPTMFPDTTGDRCTQEGPVPIPVGPGNEAKITALLTKALATTDPNFPDGPCVTNIDTGIQQAATDPGLKDKTRKSYVLLLSDGAQAGCSAAGGDTGTTKIITDLSAAGVKTFVVGFGAGVDGAQLDIFATSGGVPSAGTPTKYYKAEDAATLDKALSTIGSLALGCDFVLGKAPPDPAKIYVFFENTTEVPRDPTHTNGWDYDPKTNTVTFYGMSCADIKAEKIKDVDIVFGCKQPTPS